MRLSSVGLDLIEGFEQFRSHPYLDQGGVATIGFGTTKIAGRPVTLDTPPITLAQAHALKRVDIAKAERAVDRLITVPLTQGQYDALVSFTYNCGAGALQRSTLRQRINRGDSRVSDQFLVWNKVKGRVSLGLTRRRAAEARLFMA